MKPLPRTYQLAHAAGTDAGNRSTGCPQLEPATEYDAAHNRAERAGNRSMRRAGRRKWNDRNYAAAVKEFERIYPRPRKERTRER